MSTWRTSILTKVITNKPLGWGLGQADWLEAELISPEVSHLLGIPGIDIRGNRLDHDLVVTD